MSQPQLLVKNYYSLAKTRIDWDFLTDFIPDYVSVSTYLRLIDDMPASFIFFRLLSFTLSKNPSNVARRVLKLRKIPPR